MNIKGYQKAQESTQLQKKNPKYFIISVGKNNRYGHLHQEILNYLGNSKVYRTDQDGSIMFEIKNRLIKSEIYDKTKDYSKERHKVITYFEIGKLLYEAGSIYGEDIIGKYSEKLMIEVGRKYDRRTLYRMKKFYIMFCELESLQTVNNN